MITFSLLVVNNLSTILPRALSILSRVYKAQRGKLMGNNSKFSGKEGSQQINLVKKTEEEWTAVGRKVEEFTTADRGSAIQIVSRRAIVELQRSRFIV